MYFSAALVIANGFYMITNYSQTLVLDLSGIYFVM